MKIAEQVRNSHDYESRIRYFYKMIMNNVFDDYSLIYARESDKIFEDVYNCETYDSYTKRIIYNAYKNNFNDILLEEYKKEAYESIMYFRSLILSVYVEKNIKYDITLCEQINNIEKRELEECLDTLFEESNVTSMKTYIFKKRVLRLYKDYQYLEKDIFIGFIRNVISINRFEIVEY